MIYLPISRFTAKTDFDHYNIIFIILLINDQELEMPWALAVPMKNT